MSSKLLFSGLLLFQIALELTTASCLSDGYLERNPELQQYQDLTKCLPLTQTWYLVYRNYPEDPAMGSDAKCVRGGQRGPVENDTVPIFLSYRPNTNRNGTLSFRSSEGYEVRDILDLKVGGGRHLLNCAEIKFGWHLLNEINRFLSFFMTMDDFY